jgi:hypothetical protein
MDYQGRSPLKDITRSVIMGAAMIPAAVLAGCSRQARPQSPDSNPPVGNDNTVTMTPGDAGINPVIQAPPPELVRPRTPPGGTGGGASRFHTFSSRREASGQSSTWPPKFSTPAEKTFAPLGCS